MDIEQKWLHEQYVVNGRSFADIANELGIYAQAVRRAAIKAGITPRERSAAQINALKSGRAQHPTQGRPREETVKLRISEGVAKKWSQATPEMLQQRSETARQQWNNMSEDERQHFLKLAGDAVRVASKEGSQLEKFLFSALTNAGFVIEYHREGLVSNQKLELDLFLPALSTAIEIDGPSHFLPIWGEENLQRNIRSDLEKTGLLLNLGITLIRVKHIKNTVSKKTQRDLLNSVLAILEEIRDKYPTPPNRLIEIEV